MIKLYLYIIIIPLSMLVLESVNTNGIFKKNRIPFIKILFLMLSFALSYLVVNFFIDFADCINSIK